MRSAYQVVGEGGEPRFGGKLWRAAFSPVILSEKITGEESGEEAVGAAAWAVAVDASGSLVAASTDAPLGPGGRKPNPRAVAADAFGGGAGATRSGRRTRARAGRNASFFAAASTVPVARSGTAWTVIGQSSSKVQSMVSRIAPSRAKFIRFGAPGLRGGSETGLNVDVCRGVGPGSGATRFYSACRKCTQRNCYLT